MKCHSVNLPWSQQGCSESPNSCKTGPKLIFLNLIKTKKVLAKHIQNGCFAVGPTEPQHNQNTPDTQVQNSSQTQHTFLTPSTQIVHFPSPIQYFTSYSPP